MINVMWIELFLTENSIDPFYAIYIFSENKLINETG